MFPLLQVSAPADLTAQHLLLSALSAKLLLVLQVSGGTSALRKHSLALPQAAGGACAPAQHPLLIPTIVTILQFPQCETQEGRDDGLFIMASSESDTGPATIKLA